MQQGFATPLLRRKKFTAFGLVLTIASVVLPSPQAQASRYAAPSLGERVRTSQPIFIGTATKMTVIDAAPTGKMRPAHDSSPRRGSALEWPYSRLITFHIQVEEVFKSLGGHLPRNVTIKLMRTYVRPWEIKRDIEALRAQLINRPQIYLVGTDEHFDAQGMEHKNRILAILGKRVTKIRKVASPADMFVLPESEVPITAHPTYGGQWLN